MIAPHELKNKTFARTVRGYNPVEVDAYFDFLIEKYTEAYKTVSELEQKYSKVKTKYSELSNEEESIRSAILKAQKLGEAIVNNAKKDADDKAAELTKRCEAIIQEAKDKVQEEKEKLLSLRKMAMDFQHKLYEDYVKHVEMIRAMEMDEMPDLDTILCEDEKFDNAKNSIIGCVEAPSENTENNED